MTSYDAYVLYLGLKSHFTQKSYDFIKYKGKLKSVSPSSFESRKDRYLFDKLAKKSDPKGFLISNFVSGVSWLGDMISGNDGETNYKSWQKRNQSITYFVKSQLSLLDSDFNANFLIPEDGSHPVLLKLFLGKKISAETLCVLLDVSGARSYWDKTMREDPMWKETSLLVDKYSPFLSYDKDKIRESIVDFFEEE